MADLKGRVALVTGASQGIGRACALELARAGAAVALAARSREKLAAVEKEIAGSGGTAASFAMDVASEGDVQTTVKGVLSRFGRIDVLVNNAGITRDQLVLRLKRADWDAVLEVNLTGAYLCIQQALGAMLKQRWGRIINIASINGQAGQPGQSNYAASKAGLIGLTLSVAREVASRNITCNAVAPGYVETEMTAGLAPELKEKMLSLVPLGRAGTPADVAHAVVFLASEEASYITGHVLNVNGGALMG